MKREQEKVKYVKLKEEFNPGTQKYEPVLPSVKGNSNSKPVQFKMPKWWPLLLLVVIFLIAHYFLILKFEGNIDLQMITTIIISIIIIILLSIITYLSVKNLNKK